MGGATYEAIAAAGGGIRSTVAATRSATEDDLLEGAAAGRAALAAGGVTTIEVKSGYGLDLDTELRMLRVARRLPERVPVDVVTTFLGAHTVPPEFDGDRRRLPRLRVRRGAPGRRRGPAGRRGRRVLRAHRLRRRADRRVSSRPATALGLRVKLHADQLTDGGGAALAARPRRPVGRPPRARVSRGHRGHGRGGTVAVLLPGRGVRARRRHPATGRRAAGGRAFRWPWRPTATRGRRRCCRSAWRMHLACTRFGLTVAEAIDGATVHAAAALGLGRRGRRARARRPRRPGGLGRRATGRDRLLARR